MDVLQSLVRWEVFDAGAGLEDNVAEDEMVDAVAELAVDAEEARRERQTGNAGLVLGEGMKACVVLTYIQLISSSDAAPYLARGAILGRWR